MLQRDHNVLNTDATAVNLKRLPCIARADFIGDALFCQLTVVQNDRLNVDFSRPPQNGWRWAKSVSDGQKGWIPDWAAQPVVLTQQCPSPRCIRRNSLRRSKDLVNPMESISEVKDFDNNVETDSNGFDENCNHIMGGSSNMTETITKQESRDEPSHPPEKSMQSKQHEWNIVNRFQKAVTGQKEKNPYTKKQDVPEWDGCESPQIVNDSDGRVAIIEADGDASYYNCERSYARTKKAQATIDKLSTSTKAVATKLSTVTQTVGSRVAKKFQKQKKNQTSVNNLAKESSTAPNDNRFNLKFSKVIGNMHSKCNKENDNDNNTVVTQYCDADGNIQSLKEDNRISSYTTMQIYY